MYMYMYAHFVHFCIVACLSRLTYKGVMMWDEWHAQLLGILDQLLYYTAHYADVDDVSDNAVREETWTVMRAYTVSLNDAGTGVINVTINESQRDQRVWVELDNTTGQSNT